MKTRKKDFPQCKFTRISYVNTAQSASRLFHKNVFLVIKTNKLSLFVKILRILASSQRVHFNYSSSNFTAFIFSECLRTFSKNLLLLRVYLSLFQLPQVVSIGIKHGANYFFLPFNFCAWTHICIIYGLKSDI